MQAFENLNLPSLLDTIVSLSTAFVLGGLIGFERQVRQRTDGLRTNTLVAVGAAVFVGIDGHVAVVTAVVDSYRAAPAIASVEPRVLGALAGLIPAGVALAVPWLVTAAVIEIASGAGMRLAGRAGLHVPTAAAVPAALVMMTATLVATFAVAFAALVRGAL